MSDKKRFVSRVKADVEDVFHDAFEKCWQEIVEPKLKESYRNGIEDGLAQAAVSDDTGERKPAARTRPRWGSHRKDS